MHVQAEHVPWDRTHKAQPSSPRAVKGHQHTAHTQLGGTVRKAPVAAIQPPQLSKVSNKQWDEKDIGLQEERGNRLWQNSCCCPLPAFKSCTPLQPSHQRLSGVLGQHGSHCKAQSQVCAAGSPRATDALI